MVRCFTAIAVLCAGLAATPAARAADPAPFPEFTFKRVKVPRPGSGPRITVQITPRAPTEPAQDTPAAPPAPTAPDAYAWFWAEVSPSLSASGPGRLAKALRQLSQGPAPAAPRLQDLQRIVSAHGADILGATIGTRVSPALVLAVISTESSGRTGAQSAKGATGLMQLMPDTAARFGVEDISDPAQNIRGGVAYLDWLMQTFSDDPVLVLAGYNAGENAVRRFEGVPPYDETRGYVPKVLTAWTVARGMCQTPPELISDGCAFLMPGS